METLTQQPPILSIENLPYILVAVLFAIGFVVINYYMTRTAKN